MSARRPALRRALLGIVGSASLVVALAACSGGDGEDPSPSGGTASETASVPEDVSEVPTAEASDDATEPTDEATDGDDTGDDTGDGENSPGIEDVPTAEVGSCINLMDVLTVEGVSDIPTVDCSEEHDAQVFAVVDLPDGEFPGDEAVTSSITSECEAAFEGFVGTPPDESALAFDGLGPSEATWAVGDRSVICLAFYEDLTTVTESFENSGL